MSNGWSPVTNSSWTAGDSACHERLENDNRFHIFAAVEGRILVSGDGVAKELERGDTLLVPAGCRKIELEPQGRAVLLDMYLP